jgi:predicted  nucleic acid-binding Zn-ribbon protein
MQKQIHQIQEYQRQVQVIPALEAEVVRLQESLESSLKESLATHTQTLEELNRQLAEAQQKLADADNQKQMLQMLASSSTAATEELKMQHALEVARMSEIIQDLRLQLEGMQGSDQRLAEVQVCVTPAELYGIACGGKPWSPVLSC